MKKLLPRVSALALLAGLSVLPACGVPPVPISSHTLTVGASQETDVVWLRKDDRIYRCFTDAQGPICMEARGLR